MYKTVILLAAFVLAAFPLRAQETTWAWFTDLHIGAMDAGADLAAAIEDVNTRGDAAFVLVTGDITEKGYDSELEEAKDILEQLESPYYIIPGNHDTKWSESGCTMFSELWGDDKFYFNQMDIAFAGLNSGIPWRGGGGHIAVEDMQWLDEHISSMPPGQKTIFVTHHPVSAINNWPALNNILRKRDTRAILFGHGHASKTYDYNGIPGIMSRATLDKGGSGWAYTRVRQTLDSLYFYEVSAEGEELFASLDLTEQLTVPEIDTTDFEAYAAEPLWQYDLGHTTSASLLVHGEYIVAAETDGAITCFGQDGRVLWQYETESPVFSKPAAQGETLAVGTIGGDLLTFDIASGNLEKSIGIGVPVTSELVIIPAMVMGRESYAIIVGTAYGSLYAYDIDFLNELWANFDATGMIETKPLFAGDRLIYGAWDMYLYCVDAGNGMSNWRWTENENFYYSPAACRPVSDGSNVFVTTPDKHVSSIDMLLGATEWRQDGFQSWESIGISNDGATLFVKSIENDFFKVNSANGKKEATVAVGYPLDTTPVTPVDAGGAVIFGAKDGCVYAVSDDNEVSKLLFLGDAQVLSIQQVSETVFAASNLDGRIVLFTYNVTGE